jgi:hypothetical protein
VCVASEHDINGAILFDVDLATLRDMGISTVGERMRILIAIRKLKQEMESFSGISSGYVEVNFNSELFSRGEGVRNTVHMDRLTKLFCC